jgi:hypothetical protein
MRAATTWGWLVAVAALLLTGCGSTSVAAPSSLGRSGGSTVRVLVTPTGIRVAPATVPAGPVRLDITREGGADFVFIGASTGPDSGLEPLSEAQLGAVLHGDLFHTYTSAGLGARSDLGTLAAGNYLLVRDGVVELAPDAYDSIPPDGFAVLRVSP